MYIFVYGTLMRGESAHDYLAGARFVGSYCLRDYAIYNLGWYPGIYPKPGSVVLGEVYEIAPEMLPDMDRYEGEGSLYHRRTVVVENKANSVEAYAYVYAREINGTEIKGGRWNMKKSERVWYACYGSNMLEDRFKCYIDGKIRYFYDVEVTNSGCSDRSLWTDSRFASFKGELYFAKDGSRWGAGGVAFYDPTGNSSVYMRLYNITWEQLQKVHRQEGPVWYPSLLLLGCDENGIPIYTITADDRDEANAPSTAYFNVIRDALVKERGMDEIDALKYLNASIF